MKDKTLAAILALFLGVIGIHKFYLKQNGAGLFYLIAALIFPVIPLILSIYDFIVLLSMKKEKFDSLFNKA